MYRGDSKKPCLHAGCPSEDHAVDGETKRPDTTKGASGTGPAKDGSRGTAGELHGDQCGEHVTSHEGEGGDKEAEEEAEASEGDEGEEGAEGGESDEAGDAEEPQEGGGVAEDAEESQEGGGEED